MMNTLHRFVAAMAIVVWVASSYAQGTVVENTIMPFFEAMKAGDVGSIEKYLGEPLSSEVNVLLRENKDYPDLLRQRYAESTGHATQVRTLPGGEVIVDLKVSSPIYETEYLELLVIEGDDGNWKIVEQQRVR